MPGEDIKVVIADDHPTVRNGLRELLSSVDGIRVAAEATTGRQAVQEALRHRPDVLLMDLQMPDLNGIAATREVAGAAPNVAVQVNDRSEAIARVRKAGLGQS